MNERRCGFCGHPVKMASDSPKARTYQCDPCNAVETIFKSSSGSWWYAGWKRLDGATLRTPTSAEMMAGDFGWKHDAEGKVTNRSE